jgi:hypothetical protein
VVFESTSSSHEARLLEEVLLSNFTKQPRNSGYAIWVGWHNAGSVEEYEDGQKSDT